MYFIHIFIWANIEILKIYAIEEALLFRCNTNLNATESTEFSTNLRSS